MIKKILFVVIIVISTSFPLSAALTAPYVGIHLAAGEVSYWPFKNNYYNLSDTHTANFSARFMIDLTLGKRVFFSWKYGLGNADIFTAGMGVGWYIFDKRKEGVGESLTAIVNFMGKNMYSINYSMGGEFSIFYNKSIYKHLTLRVGGYFGVDALSVFSEGERGIGISYGLILGLAI